MPIVDCIYERGQFFLPLSLTGSSPHYFIFDTGAGVSAVFIAAALEDGHLTTIEQDPAWAKLAKWTLESWPWVLIEQEPKGTFDLVFIDSGYEYRATDIREWLTNGYTGLVVAHDADRRYAELDLGVGVWVPSQAGMWVGRGRA